MGKIAAASSPRGHGARTILPTRTNRATRASPTLRALAQGIGVPGNRIHAIVKGSRVITGDTDLRLCKFFGLSEGYFLRLQNAYDTLEAKRRIAAQEARDELEQRIAETKAAYGAGAAVARAGRATVQVDEMDEG